MQAQKNTPAVIPLEALDGLIATLRVRGFRVLGPKIRDGAIIYDDLGAASELPIGWTDEQHGGSYRLEAPRGRGAFRLRRRAALLEAVPVSS